jgi:DNA-binding IclR family transcriptional regulator
MTAQPNRSLSHGLDVLNALCGAAGPVGSRELARHLGMEHTRVNRLLGTMAQLGLAVRSSEGSYRPGPAVNVLAANSLHSSGLLQAALPVIRELLAQGVGVALGVLWRDQVCYLFHGRPDQPFERGIGGHELFPARQSSIGTLLLAHQAMNDDVARLRSQGWAWVVPDAGGGSLSAPVGAPPQAALALIPGASGFQERLVALVVDGARRITAELEQRRQR